MTASHAEQAGLEALQKWGRSAGHHSRHLVIPRAVLVWLLIKTLLEAIFSIRHGFC